MKTVWKENYPKYKAGDLVLYYEKSGSFNETGIAGIIKEVVSKPLTDENRKSREEENRNRRDCCGKTETVCGTNFIYYKLESGKTVYEGMILYTGVDKINGLLSHLRTELLYYKKARRKAAIALGVDEYDIRD